VPDGEKSPIFNMNLDEIKQLIDLANESGVAELEVQRGESRVRIRRAVVLEGETVIRDSGGYLATGQGLASSAGAGTAKDSPAVPEKAAAEDANTIVVKSPIVGTYYEAGAPGSLPFVQVGDTVKPGQVLCIIESMKLMNEIECEHSGVIASIQAENGQPVEYGEPLMTIRPR
jgi:acetyl-CoA carboxylase biotin carboxyl carrier protein